MNYYPHHIGDFDRATRHLTRTERSIYRDLLDVYYDTEAPLTLDQAALCRKVIARAQEEVEAVRTVLAEFFHETPAGWYQERCEEEIEAYRKNNSQKSLAGKASAAARAKKLQDAVNGNSTTESTQVQRSLNGTPTNQEPITNNQNQEPEPIEPTLTGKTEGPKSKSATGSRLPADWKPNHADIDYCKTERPELLPSKVAQNFYDYWIAKPGKDGRKLDWSATWRSWVRKESASAAGRPASQAPRGGVPDLDEQRRRNHEEAKRLLGFTTTNDDGRTIDATA